MKYIYEDRELEKRFWKKVKKTPTCWLWKGAHTDCPDSPRFQYGIMVIDHKVVLATHLAWELEHKTHFPKGLYALHKCDVTLCVRNSHIYPGTQLQNIQDRVARGHTVSPRGERMWKSKLKENDIYTIRAMIEAGLKDDEIGEKFGVQRWTICRIRYKKNWAWLK